MGVFRRGDHKSVRGGDEVPQDAHRLGRRSTLLVVVGIEGRQFGETVGELDLDILGRKRAASASRTAVLVERARRLPLTVSNPNGTDVARIWHRPCFRSAKSFREFAQRLRATLSTGCRR
jgi:hypothetical protein